MAEIEIREVSISSKVEILGHVFKGLADIKRAVESDCGIGSLSWDIWEIKPKSPVDGIHVICVYKRYPCFDSEDYANENRSYSNYFFSTEPFTKQQIKRLSKLPCRFNAQIVNETIPHWATPAIYYGGTGDKMIVATPL